MYHQVVCLDTLYRFSLALNYFDHPVTFKIIHVLDKALVCLSECSHDDVDLERGSGTHSITYLYKIAICISDCIVKIYRIS